VIHSDTADVERSLHELKHAQFRVKADVALKPEEFTGRRSSKFYDVILAKYPAATDWESRAVKFLLQNGKHTPVIFLTDTIERETVSELIRKGATDCVPMDNIGHLPVVVRRVLNEERLREQRDRAQEKLRRSEAHYRALVGNLMYGICRCSMDGKILDANPAFMTMLGCSSKEELLAANFTNEIVRDPVRRQQLLGGGGQFDRSDGLEVDWNRKDGTPLKARLSGREVIATNGSAGGYEIIAEDVTKQRELENYLRQQAAKDSLTGLANYRSLVAAIDSEIKRSKRTGREFALLLFDLDDLKKINDRYGHLVGSQALCRLADVMSIGCRDLDTAARFGGDEFALVLPETAAEDAKIVAQRICRAFSNGSQNPGLSVSVGVSTYPRDGEAVDTLLAAADLALYAMKAKIHGRERAPSGQSLPLEVI
jgi:diguanylate cyclase (GGDEF)-like protein/PAS domain S-box-containing protein